MHIAPAKANFSYLDVGVTPQYCGFILALLSKKITKMVIQYLIPLWLLDCQLVFDDSGASVLNC